MLAWKFMGIMLSFAIGEPLVPMNSGQNESQAQPILIEAQATNDDCTSDKDCRSYTYCANATGTCVVYDGEWCDDHACGKGDGDCDKDEHCSGDLVCGDNNCRKFHNMSHIKKRNADCCTDPALTITDVVSVYGRTGKFVFKSGGCSEEKYFKPVTDLYWCQDAADALRIIRKGNPKYCEGLCKKNVATCDDNIWNQDEEGMDCGGSCPIWCEVVVIGSCKTDGDCITEQTCNLELSQCMECPSDRVIKNGAACCPEPLVAAGVDKCVEVPQPPPPPPPPSTQTGAVSWYCAVKVDGTIVKKTLDLTVAQRSLGDGSRYSRQAIIPMQGQNANDPHTLPKKWGTGSMWWWGYDDIYTMQDFCEEQSVPL